MTAKEQKKGSLRLQSAPAGLPGIPGSQRRLQTEENGGAGEESQIGPGRSQKAFQGAGPRCRLEAVVPRPATLMARIAATKRPVSHPISAGQLPHRGIGIVEKSAGAACPRMIAPHYTSRREWSARAEPSAAEPGGPCTGGARARLQARGEQAAVARAGRDDQGLVPGGGTESLLILGTVLQGQGAALGRGAPAEVDPRVPSPQRVFPETR